MWIQILEVVWNQNPQVSLILQLIHIQLSEPVTHRRNVIIIITIIAVLDISL